MTPRYSNGTTPFSGSLKVDSMVTREPSCLILLTKLTGEFEDLSAPLSSTHLPEKLPSSFALIDVPKVITNTVDSRIALSRTATPSSPCETTFGSWLFHQIIPDARLRPPAVPARPASETPCSGNSLPTLYHLHSTAEFVQNGFVFSNPPLLVNRNPVRPQTGLWQPREVPRQFERRLQRLARFHH